jgi:hypothetical protein
MSRRLGVVLALSALVLLGLSFTPSAGALPPPADGYRLLGGDGGVFSFGHDTFFGSAASTPSNCAANTTDRTLPNGTCFSMATTPTNKGYWILNGDTLKVFHFGDATDFGEPATQFAGTSREFVPTGVSIVASPDGLGYWVLVKGLNGAGRVLGFGDAVAHGDTTTIATHTGQGFTGEPVGLAVDATGNGYWEVHSDGGVFAFGDARFFGSMGGRHLNAPIVGMTPTASGLGYWLVASDGGVFAFGDAHFAGSMGGKHLNAPIVGIAHDPDSAGYWLAASDGGVFTFGGAPFLGSMGGRTLARPVFAISVPILFVA